MNKEGLTRREVLIGAGAFTALGAVSLSACKAKVSGHWDHEADIVIVGTGVGAATAAVTAKENGDSAVMVEKAEFFGGTSSKSAGVLWVPNNFVLRGNGVTDSKEDCLQYMARYSYPEQYDPDSPTLGLSDHGYSLLAAYYDNAAAAVDMLRAKGALNIVEWRMFQLDRSATDYLDNVPENRVPTGRALGVQLPDGSIGLGAHMMAQLQKAVNARNIPVQLNHRVVRVVVNDAGRVAGIEAEHDGEVVTFKARKGVIFATGGYVHNPTAISYYQRNQLYGSCAMPAAVGDFINIAGAAGARLGNMSGAWRTQIVFEEALVDRRLAGGVFFPPGDSMFQVNKYGVRAVNENRNYNDRTEVHGIYDPSKAEFPNQLMFMIYDQRSAEAYAGVYPFPKDPAAGKQVLQGDTLAALTAAIEKRLKEIANRTGGFALDPAFAGNLQNTLQRFNDFARSGIDEDFHRGAAQYDSEWFQVFSPMVAGSSWPANNYPSVTMYPLKEEGPYYAIILAAGALDTNGGPVIDAAARVLNTEDKPIPGLYGAGNCIASPSRDAYWGAGCTLGLSLTFGYIAANAVHKDAVEA